MALVDVFIGFGWACPECLVFHLSQKDNDIGAHLGAMGHRLASIDLNHQPTHRPKAGDLIITKLVG